MSISTEWIRNVRSDKEAQDFEEVLRNHTMVADRLLELLSEWEETLNAKEAKESDFDTPNWDVKEAYRLGQRSTIRRIRDLYSFRTQRN
jgi:hypothetical protein